MPRPYSAWLRMAPGVVGVVCLALAVLDNTLPGDTSRALQLSVSGAALLSLFAALHARRIGALARSRSARRGANAVILTVVFTLGLVLIQAISLENRKQVDITRGSLFSLAPQSLQIAKGLESPIVLQGFFRQGSDAAAEARVLFEMYEYASPEITWDIVDPDRNPTLTTEAGASTGSVLVRSGDQRSLARRATEQAISSAILKVTRKREQWVYFLVGHGEKQLDETGRGGYAKVRDALSNQGYSVRELSLLDVERVPDDCELLVVAGPTSALLQSEVERVRTWLRAGGRALFLIDPRRQLPGLSSVLDEFRLALDPVVLLDRTVVVGQGDRVFDATVTKVKRYGGHDITKGFNSITLFPMARPVRIEDAGAADPCTPQYLAWTGKSSWGETNMESFRSGRASFDGDDYVAPLPVAAAVERRTEPRPARVVVFGDSDFANNTFFGVLGNQDLFLNAVSWLTGNADLISLRTPRPPGDRIFINAAQGRLIFVLCLVFPPLAIIAVGATVLTRRRRS